MIGQKEKGNVMYIKKNELLKELKFCQSLMDRIVEYTEANYTDKYFDRKHTVIQADIIRLRRELNEVRAKLDWRYGDDK